MYFSTVFISIQYPLTPKSNIASSKHAFRRCYFGCTTNDYRFIEIKNRDVFG